MILSFVVCIYNIESYLKECIDSIISLKRDDIEILCINDGSTDDSLNILNEYQLKDKRIKIISQDNKGLSITRNIGIINARGKYIWFIDGDDQVYTKKITKLLNTLNNEDFDVISFNFIENKKNKSNLISKNTDIYNSILSGTEYLEKSIINKKYKVSSCCYIWKKSFLIDNNLLFTPNIYHEDIENTTKSIILANKLLSFNEVLYLYKVRNNSITTDKSRLNKRIEDLFIIEKNLIIFFNSNYILDKNYIKILLSNKIFFQILLISKFNSILDRKLNKRIKELNSFKEMKNIDSFFYKMVYWIFKLI